MDHQVLYTIIERCLEPLILDPRSLDVSQKLP
jgi:hypothetical protein